MAITTKSPPTMLTQAEIDRRSEVLGTRYISPQHDFALAYLDRCEEAASRARFLAKRDAASPPRKGRPPKR